MAPATAATLEAPPRSATSPAENRAADSTAPPKPSRRTLESLLRNATDDEILGLVPARKIISRDERATKKDAEAFDADTAPDSAGASAQSYDRHSATASGEGNREADAPETSATPLDAAILPAEARAALDANPELRRAWQDAQAYRENFATPEDARNATALVADLNRMDALFFSRRPEDHAELARSIATLDPAAFASLAQAIASVAADSPFSRAPSLASRSAGVSPANFRASSESQNSRQDAGATTPAPAAENSAHAVATSHATANANAPSAAGASPAQTEFFHATNAATVEGVLEAIESQVERLLPEGVSKSARSRVVGEIYRELDTTLRSNRQLGQQMREAFRSGALDADHQHAIVSLVTGRARQALPAVAKRVLNEWTSTIVAANQDGRARQRTAERRVDIAGSSGSGSDSRRGTSPRDINYSRMSDADILNL